MAYEQKNKIQQAFTFITNDISYHNNKKTSYHIPYCS